MNDIINTLRQQTEDFNRQRAELVANLKTNFSGMFTELWEQYPEIRSFKWTQYTPYFNDGDPCTFSRGDIWASGAEYPESNWEDDDDHIIADGDAILAWKTYLETGSFPADYHVWLTDERAKMYERNQEATRDSYILAHYISKETQEYTLETMDRAAEVAIAASEMQSLLSAMPDDVFESLFGDHVVVTVNREGVHVDEYDHD